MALETIPLPSQAELRRLFSYDPDTGVLRCIGKASRKHHPGMVAGTRHKDGGLQVRIAGVIYQAHRIIWKWMTGEEPVEVDHWNRVRSDNSWENLRDASRTENMANMGLRDCNKVRFKGVYKTKSGKYLAQTKFDSRHFYLGVYDTPEEAHEKYCIFTQFIFGAFARAS